MLQCNVIGIQFFEFGIQIFGEGALLRSELQGIGKRIIPLGQQGLPIAGIAGFSIGGLKAVLQMVAESAQQPLIRLRMKPPDAVIFVRLFDQAQAAFAGLRSKNQDADIDPLIAEEVRRVAEYAVGEGTFSRRGAWV